MKHLPTYLSPESESSLGRKQEKKARQHINSGAVWFDKGDIDVKDTNENYFIDVKKANKSFSLSYKIVNKTFLDGIPKTPVILVYLGNEYIVKCIIQKQIK